MATYPSLPIDAGNHKRNRRDGRREDILGDGIARVAKVHADRSDFEFLHPMLTSAQLSTWTTFYNANATASSIDFVWPVDGVTYQVRFGSMPDAPEWKPGGYYDVRVRLVAAA